MAKVGAKQTYNAEIQRKAEEYIDYFLKPETKPADFEEEVPTSAGLALHIRKATSTVYKWEDEEGKEAFKDVMDLIRYVTEVRGVSRGLRGEYNPVITKLILGKCGYHDSQKLDHASTDGSMSPKEPAAVDAKLVKSLVDKLCD